MELKKTFIAGLMNKDFDVRLIPEGEYIDAQNIIVSNSEGSSIGLVQKSNGLEKLTNINIPSDAITIGSVSEEGNECIYWFITSSAGNFIYEYNVLDNSSLTLILADNRSANSNVLNFDPKHKITGANVIYNSFNNEKLLIWTDDLNPIRCININRAKSLPTNGFDTQDISLYKRAPYEAPKCTPTQFGDGTENNIKERFLSFGYRYKYLDGEYSATSAFSNPQFYPSDFSFDFSTQENEGMVNSFNAVNIVFETGDKNVTDIQLLFKESNSGIIYIIENFNKKEEGYGNNSYKSFLFSNNKIYSILPEDEVNRLYDNIPIIAKAQEFIGNRLIFGNYVEGRDLVDINQDKVNINIEAGYTSQEFSDIALQFTLSNTLSINDTLSIEFQPDSLKKGKIINISFRSNSESPFFGNYQADLSFYLDNDYANAYELSVSSEFINFISSVATNQFLNFDFTNTVPVGDVATYFTYEILASTNSNVLKLKIPYINHTSGNEYYAVNSNSVVLFLSNGNAFASCKSNRSYECGISYLDEDGRYSTVLTSKNNTSFIPIANSVTKNQLKLKIYNNPPEWATRYKIFVKDSKLSYQTIYGVFAYKEDSFLWIRLEGQDKQKVKEGDYIIIKRSIGGASETVEKLQILEYATNAPDFIDGNLNSAGDKIIERGGVYIKVKSTGSLNIEGVEKQFYDLKSSVSSTGSLFHLYCGPFSYREGTVVKDIQITPGSYIDMSITNKKYGSNGGNEEFIKKYTASGSYSNFQSWFETEGNGLGKFGVNPPYEFVRGNMKPQFGVNLFTPNPSGLLYLKIKNLLNGNGQHKSYMDSKITITTGISLLIFETDPKDNNSEIFFETQDTYLISNGKHMSRHSSNSLDVDQGVNTPAIINLDWFNCFSQGNGAESYIVKDVFNRNFLSTNSRPNAVLLDGYKQRRNIASLTYSGAFDKTTNYNSLNEFNLSRANYKDLDDKYGSIQKIHSRDTDLVVFQEDKVHRVLYNKNVLFDAVGGGQVSSVEDVLGQEIPFAGEWGISKNPESFSYYANSIYFADTNKGSVLRLGGDGLEPISKYKMRDWFKDTLRDYKSNFKYGGFDPIHDNYILSFSDQEKVMESYLSCGQVIEWLNVPANSSYVYNMDLGSNIGNHIINYSIPSGSVFDFDVNINGVVTTFLDRNGDGILSVSKPTTGSVGLLTIHNRESKICSLSLTNNCIETEELEVITLVVNDDLDISKSMTNGYSWTNSSTATSGQSYLLDIFKSNVTRFNIDSGYEGENEIPYDNSQIKVSSNKGTGNFTSCNRIGYVVTSSTLTPQQILDTATYPAITNNGNENYISFTFNRTSGQKLYLVWDYIDVENCDVEPFGVSLCYHASNFELACSCDLTPVDCEVSAWSAWSDCVNGSQTRTRTIITPASDGGAACPSLTETRNCTVSVDCVVSNWSDWSSCVNGISTRTRTVVTPSSGAGAACPTLTDTRSCDPCTSYTVSTTSGTGQSYTYIVCDGTPSGGAIGGAGGYDADTFCAQTGSVVLLGSELTLTQNAPCSEEAPTAVDCVVSAWSNWSTCDNNSQVRTRTIITPASGGGSACPVLTETQSCVSACVDYTISTTASYGTTTTYTDCLGDQQQITIGGVNGYDATTFCAIQGTVNTGNETNLSYNGPCDEEAPTPVDCEVSNWSAWSTCVDGSQTRTRTVITQPQNGGASCPVLSETQSCAMPVDCVVSAWSSWSTCDNNSQVRTRTVITPASNGGATCPVLTETQSCVSGCVDYTISTTASYGTTTTYTDCLGDQQQITIGGVNGYDATTFCAIQGSVNTGNETNLTYNGPCEETLPVDCVVSDWSAWSNCDGGTQTRSRTVITQPQDGGTTCPDLTETRNCPVDCVVSDWSAWSACNAGTKTRTRTVITPALNGGATCPTLTETEPCAVDCVVSDWSDWSACSDGLTTRTRTVVKQPLNGGASCPVLSETIGCSSINLDSTLCYTSDGSNTVTKRFRILVSNEPANYTISSRNVQNQGGLTWSIVPTHGDAYLQVEFKSNISGGSEFAIELLINNSSGTIVGSSGIVGVNNQPQTYLPSCFPPPPPPVVDCVTSEWSEWSACIDGVETRTKTVITQPQNGGAACPALVETRSCSTPVCCGDIYFDPSSYTDENLTYAYEDCATGQIQYVTVYYNSSGEVVYGRIPC